VRASYRLALLAGLAGVLVAVAFGIAYDQLLRFALAADTPTLGPWGAVRDMSPLAGRLIVLLGVFVSPTADEFFFRDGFFRLWADAGSPKLGALLSSLLFAVSRLDFVNFPAYVGLGFLLCAVYYGTGSLLAPWTTHVLLNATMFLLLFGGYD
jgi:membrane protease YdiL (CAAX protease family)